MQIETVASVLFLIGSLLEGVLVGGRVLDVSREHSGEGRLEFFLINFTSYVLLLSLAGVSCMCFFTENV